MAAGGGSGGGGGGGLMEQRIDHVGHVKKVIGYAHKVMMKKKRKSRRRCSEIN